MKLVIDICEEIYSFIFKHEFVPEIAIMTIGKAIKNGKPIEQEPTTKNDLGVDWESYKDADGNSLDYLILNVLQNNFDCGDAYGYTVADKIISLLPSVTTQEPRMGHWIVQPSNKEQDERDFIWWKCSECGQVIFSETEKDRKEFHAFCGRCGADMRGEK